MTRTALLAWEMGAGLGHTRRLLRLARALTENGFEPVLAQRNIQTLAEEVRSAGIAMVPSPPQLSLAPKNKPFRALSYADIMAVCGYADAGVLAPMLDAWDGLLRFIRPSVVVGDYCPVLPMATRGRFPFVAFGDGFVVPPPDVQDFPQLRPQGEPVKPPGQILDDVNGLLAARNQPGVKSLAELVAGDRQHVCTFPELDIYRQYRATPAQGPLDELPPVREPPTTPRLFVYLAADFKRTREVLQAVLKAGVPVEGFVRDAPSGLRGQLRDGGMMLHDHPPDLADRLRDSSAILHHGGIGTLETALAMGCPQLLLTRHLEQSLNARNLTGQQIGRAINNVAPGNLSKMIRQSVNDRAWQSLCQDLARRLDKRRPFSSMDGLVKTIQATAS